MLAALCLQQLLRLIALRLRLSAFYTAAALNNGWQPDLICFRGGARVC